MTVGSAEWLARHGTAVAACRLAQCELARRDARIVALEADPDDAGAFPFRAEFPERYVAWTGAEASLIGADSSSSCRSTSLSSSMPDLRLISNSAV